LQDLGINGYSNESSIDLGHETLCLSQEETPTNWFCKTNHKPYDIVVIAILALWERAGLLTRTRSDGDVDDFAENAENALRHSRDESLCYYETDDDAIKLGYKFPEAEKFIDAFHRIAKKLDLERPIAPPPAPKGFDAMPEKVWF